MAIIVFATLVPQQFSDRQSHIAQQSQQLFRAHSARAQHEFLLNLMGISCWQQLFMTPTQRHRTHIALARRPMSVSNCQVNAGVQRLDVGHRRCPEWIQNKSSAFQRASGSVSWRMNVAGSLQVTRKLFHSAEAQRVRCCQCTTTTNRLTQFQMCSKIEARISVTSFLVSTFRDS